MKMKKHFLLMLFFLSGASGLGYEILWTRMLSTGLGHEIVSVMAVICAFFCGIALGSWTLDKSVSKSSSPEKWYVFFEIIIGSWGLILSFFLPVMNRWVVDLVGVSPTPFWHWLVSFAYPFFILLPATYSMGGTLPAMDRLFGNQTGGTRQVSTLYSANTIGAVFGTMAVTFFLIPALGMKYASFFLVFLNYTVAAGVYILPGKKEYTGHKNSSLLSFSVNTRHIYLILFVTGFAGIGFEILMIRIFSQIFENTVFSFAVILTIFLLGTSLGAKLYQTYHDKKEVLPFERILSVLLFLNISCCLISTYSLIHIESQLHFIKHIFGDGFSRIVYTELTLSIIYLVFPTVFMGATFGHIAQFIKTEDGGVGRALCLNTIGGAFSPLVFGLFLLPLLGIKFALMVIPTVYLMCMPRVRDPFAVAAFTVVVLTFFLSPGQDRYRFVSLSDGEELVSYKDGVMASVSVIKDTKDNFHLKVNNHFQMGGTTSVFSDRRQAYLPILLHKQPERALFLGLGTGTTFAAAGHFPNLQATGVELVPEVIDAMAYSKKSTGDIAKKKNLKIVSGDARRFVTASEEKYDVVVADLFHPARDGAGSLYTVEHFSAIKQILTEDGIFCQWLPLYQLDLDMLKVIIKTFLEIYPNGQAYLAHYSVEQPIIGLIGGHQPLRFPERWYRKRIKNKNLQRFFASYGYDSFYSLVGTFLSGGEKLKTFVDDSPINTDQFPVVVFKAPRSIHDNQLSVKERLVALIDALSPPVPDTILSEIITEEDYLARTRLPAYWAARDSFLKIGTDIERTTDVMKLYKTASEPLLEIVKKSIDFSAAYYPLISIAYELYPFDKEASYNLLRKLERANPLKPEAGILRQRLFAATDNKFNLK